MPRKKKTGVMEGLDIQKLGYLIAKYGPDLVVKTVAWHLEVHCNNMTAENRAVALRKAGRIYEMVECWRRQAEYGFPVAVDPASLEESHSVIGDRDYL
jgi:hypothetical protein